MMPVPILVWGAAALISAIFGGKKALDAHDKYSNAKSINCEANRMAIRAERTIYAAREQVEISFKNLGSQKLEILIKSMTDFQEAFSQIHSINVTQTNSLGHSIGTIDLNFVENLRTITLNAKDIAFGAGQAGFAGALTAFGTYGTVALLGHASSGTAIATLSGIAAKNATLAYLGGGSIAAGGGGMAAGAIILGGLITGPAIAVGGFIADNKAQVALEKARTNIADAQRFLYQANMIETNMKIIFYRVNEMIALLQNLDVYFINSNSLLRKVVEQEGTNFQKYSSKGQGIVFKTFKIAQVINGLINVDLLTEKGELTKKSEEQIQTANTFLFEILDYGEVQE